MKTNLGLVEYVNSKLKLPTIYMLSGFGRVLTAAAVDKRIAKGDQHTIQNEAIIRAGIGDYVYDCCGLVKGYLWEVAPGSVIYKTIDGVYDATSDQGVAGMYNTAPVKGPIAEMPDVPGMLVFTADLGHVGVYVGKKNGVNQYVESTPAWKAWGVTTSADKNHPQRHNRKWTYYGQHRLITYVKPEPPKPEPVPVPEPVKPVATLKVGDKVKITGTNYSTGQTIPNTVKAKVHTVMQIDKTKALLKEIYSWVDLDDLVLATVTPEPIPTPEPAPAPKPVDPPFVIRVGDKVKIIGNKYATGQPIPYWVVKKYHTVGQISGTRVLLKEISSWVYIKDVVKV